MLRRGDRLVLWYSSRRGPADRYRRGRPAPRGPGPQTVECLAAVPQALPSEPAGQRSGSARSEEHTSELQSPCNLVCRLLLEKKKNKPTRINEINRQIYKEWNYR